VIQIHIHEASVDSSELLSILGSIQAQLNTQGDKMADIAKINQAIDNLQSTVDMTQENVAAILELVRSNPSAAELAEIERRLQAVQTDLASTSYETGDGTQEPEAPVGEDQV